MLTMKKSKDGRRKGIGFENVGDRGKERSVGGVVVVVVWLRGKFWFPFRFR